MRIARFFGLDNVHDPVELPVGALTEATNVHLNNGGSVKTRPGRTRIYSGNLSGAWMDPQGRILLFQEGTDLKRLERVGSDWQAVTLRGGLTPLVPGERLCGLFFVDRAFWSNGYETGVVQEGRARSWGIAPPSRQPALEATSGLFQAGRWQVAVTFQRGDGQESGTGLQSVLDLSETSGIRLSGIPVSTDLDVLWVNLYLSGGADGEKLFLAAKIPNGQTEYTLSGPLGGSGQPLATQFMTSPPPGRAVAHQFGRVFIAQGSQVYATMTNAPGDVGFELVGSTPISLGEEVTLLAPVGIHGLYLSTRSATWFLAGEFPDAPTLTEVGYGAVPGSQVVVDGSLLLDGSIPGKIPLWLSPRGVCAGLPDGTVRNLTVGRTSWPVGESATAMVRHHDGSTHVVMVQDNQLRSAFNRQA